jgi:hypothetical protein
MRTRVRHCIKWLPAALMLMIISESHRDTHAEPPRLRTLAKGSFSGIAEAKKEVLKDQAAWEKLWTKHTSAMKPGEKLPAVNFEKEVIIVVTMGRQRTGGYAIEILSAKEIDKHFQITIRKTLPKPGSMAIQALTAPFHFAAAPKSDMKPQFMEEN